MKMARERGSQGVPGDHPERDYPDVEPAALSRRAGLAAGLGMATATGAAAYAAKRQR
jgi:hypothetical protein